MLWTNLKDREEFPSGPVVRTRAFTAGVWVQSPIRELRLHKQAISKRKNIKRQRVDWEEVFTTFNTDKVQILKMQMRLLQINKKEKEFQ